MRAQAAALGLTTSIAAGVLIASAVTSGSVVLPGPALPACSQALCPSWSAALDHRADTPVVVAVEGGVVAADRSGRVIALRGDGSRSWVAPGGGAPARLWLSAPADDADAGAPVLVIVAGADRTVAREPATGRPVWQVEATASGHASSEGLTVLALPDSVVAIADDGSIVWRVTGDAPALLATVEGIVGRAVGDALTWHDAATGAVRGEMGFAGPVVALVAVDDLLVAATVDGSLHAIDVSAAEVSWRVELGAPLVGAQVRALGGFGLLVTSAVATGVDGQTVVGQVLAIRRSGQVQWVAPLELPWFPGLVDPVVAGDLVLLGHIGAGAGPLIALETRNGRERWRTDLGDGSVLVAGVVDGALVTGGRSGLHLLDPADGAVLARSPVDGRGRPLLADGDVVVPLRDGLAGFAVDATG